MRTQIIFVLSALFIVAVQADFVTEIIAGILPRNDKRFSTFEMALRLAKERNAQFFIETGTTRASPGSSCVGDGCATKIFSAYNQAVNNPNMKLFSVDISPQSCKNARLNVAPYGKFAAQIIESDSVAYLQNLPKDVAIDFLYLDSYDYHRGIERQSQEHHLKEIEAAYDKLHTNTIVFMDDCSLYGGGKCKLVKEYLLIKGWKLIADQYQNIFIQGTSLVKK